MTESAYNIVTITEHVRFNADGSSDHIKVIDGELDSVEHFDKSPFVNMNSDIAWIIHNTKTTIAQKP